MLAHFHLTLVPFFTLSSSGEKKSSLTLTLATFFLAASACGAALLVSGAATASASRVAVAAISALCR